MVHAARCVPVQLTHRVPQRPYPLDLDLDGIPGGQRTDSGWRAGQYDVTGNERHHLRREGDEIVHVEDHVRGPGGLLDLAVDPRLDGQITRVDIRLHPRAEWAKPVKALGACPLAVTALDISRRHVVGTREAQHVRTSLVAASHMRPTADHYSQLRLEVDPADTSGKHDGTSRPVYRGGRLEKEDSKLELEYERLEDADEPFQGEVSYIQ